MANSKPFIILMDKRKKTALWALFLAVMGAYAYKDMSISK
jgi:hypothetical protein